LLATRISLAAVFLGIHQQILALGRALSLQWARFTERRRKGRMKVALVRKHLEKAETPLPFALPLPVAAGGPIVREVRGAGKFQIRKVTKADLRKAAEELSKQETPDPFALYAVPAPEPCHPERSRGTWAGEPDPDFEDPRYLDDEPP